MSAPQQTASGAATRSLAALAPRPAATDAMAILLCVVGIAAGAQPSGSSFVTHLTSLAGFGDALGAVCLLVALGVFGLLAFALRPRRRHKSPDDYELEQVRIPSMYTRWEQFLEWTKFVLVVGGVIVALFWVVDRLSSMNSPNSTTSPPGRAVSTTTLPLSISGTNTPSTSVSVGTWQVVAIVVAVAIGLVVLATVVGRLRRPRLAFGNAAGSLDAPLAQLVDEALSDLRHERDARRAVIRAYAAMERLFARGGRPRRAETPFEYVERSLEQAGAPRRAAIELTDLFEQARFSDHVIDTSLRTAAIRALEAVRQSEEVLQ